MWTESGHVDHHTFAGLRGGGGKGGGGGGAVAPPTPQSFTDPVNGQVFTEDFSRPGWAQAALNNEIVTRKNQEKADSDAKQAAADAEAATAKTTFEGNRDAAYNTSLQDTIKQFQRQGVDPQQYMESDILPALARAKSSVKDLDPNPISAFPSSLGGDIVNQVLGGKRTGATNQINAMFTPNWSSQMLGDPLATSYTDTLLNEQFKPLEQGLQNAYKRHTLSDVGLGAATDLLGQKRTAAKATVDDLGRGILATDRGNLDKWIGDIRGTAGGLSLADTFDPSSYAAEGKSRVGTDVSNFGGALRNAVGGTKFADLSELINAGGGAQGAANPNAANPTGGAIGGPSASAEEELQKQKRGLGSTGAF